MKKSKYDRRRAIDCKILKKSTTHKNYYKYEITVAETDGRNYTINDISNNINYYRCNMVMFTYLLGNGTYTFCG